ncbi:unnamed protein product [Phytophthora fragariaefolia]|uniref:Unnamed protein product n=1 Tax=Phytophthora fragariaefolia TaxID=1490495 RepID=A0A9W6U8B5_9STRA|nr:unnamed protein product [Phytophthora fragariaefolia]
MEFLRTDSGSSQASEDTEVWSNSSSNNTGDLVESYNFQADEQESGIDDETKDEDGGALAPGKPDGIPLPVGRDLAAELEDDADDDDDDDEQGVAPGGRPPLIPRATRNADTPRANRVLARLGEEMRSESEWMMMFAPVAMTQAKWPVLGPELAQPVNSTDINQLVEDTVLLLKAMGLRCNGRPNSLILGDWEQGCPKTCGANPFHYASVEQRRVGIVSRLRRLSGDGIYSVRRSSITSALNLTSQLTLNTTRLGERRTSRYETFLIRLNGYARTTKTQYGKGGADAFDHVELFLLNCGDDDIMDLLYPMRLDDIERVEMIINTKILGEKRKRDATGRYRRDDRRTRREDGRDRRVTVAVTSDDEEGDKVECQPSQRLGQLDYADDDSDYDREDYLDSEKESDHDYINAGLANEKSRSGNSREDSARPQRNSARTQWNSTGPQGNSSRQQPNSASHWNPVNPPPDRHSRVGRPSDRQDNYGRRGDSQERPQYGPCAARGGQGHLVHFCRKRCKFCQRVHDVGRFELFQRYERLANFVTQNVDKSKLPTDLQDLYTLSNLNPAARQHGLGWTEPGRHSQPSLVEVRTQVRSPSSYASTRDGAVNDQRTKILLDTGANISAINEVFARKLRLKRQASRDVQIGVQEIGKDKVGTSTRAWVKVTLGWEVSYEFEVWVMDHHAGVDLILGTDFMIPVGIRLDLYNSLAKLPDEVVVPLIKSQNSAGDPRGGLQATDGPTETICLPVRLTAEFRSRLMSYGYGVQKTGSLRWF